MTSDYWRTKEIPLEADSPLAVSFEKLDEELIRIHLSDCFENGLISARTVGIMNRFKSYTEYSADGEGVTILVLGNLPFVGEYDKPEKFEYTGRIIVYDRIIKNQEAIDWFLAEFGLNYGEGYEVPHYEQLPHYPEVVLDGYTLKARMTKEIRKGRRHKTLLSYGGTLLSEGMDMEFVEIKMYDLNMLYCVPPLQYSEFEGIVKSVKKYSQERDGERE